MKANILYCFFIIFILNIMSKEKTLPKINIKDEDEELIELKDLEPLFLHQMTLIYYIFQLFILMMFMGPFIQKIFYSHLEICIQ